jgi:hypothetical protein
MREAERRDKVPKEGGVVLMEANMTGALGS